MSETIGGEVVPDSTRQFDVDGEIDLMIEDLDSVSYTHLRAHET